MIVNARTGAVQQVTTLPPRDQVSALAWSADGRTLVVGEVTGLVRFLSTRTFDPVAPPRQVAAGLVIDAKFSPDGQFLSTLGSDGDLMLWDARSWTPYGKPLTDNHGWGFLAFSPDGQRLRALYEDHTMVDLSMDPSDWVADACRAANRQLTPAELAVLLPGEPYHRTCPAPSR